MRASTTVPSGAAVASKSTWAYARVCPTWDTPSAATSTTQHLCMLPTRAAHASVNDSTTAVADLDRAATVARGSCAIRAAGVPGRG